MGRIVPPLYLALCALILIGCAKIPPEDGEAGQGPSAVRVDSMDAVTDGGSGRAVLSLHKRYAGVDTCRFGLTLTNRLPYKITNIAFRFNAYLEGDVFHQSVLRNFFEIHAEAKQYREIDFSGLSCDKISHIEVTDPGRCTLGTLKRPSSRPGDCIRQVRIVETPYVKLIPKPPQGGRSRTEPRR
ncbi:MAG: hypothetical protein LGR52_02795 [Candidatus Thiosymbion ectosymbiont of Robbea hypermnestra]|nr:hypothetical protein [Candidatus Thiosymbion ectosymbiont of Robbea hypermnestra]